MMLIETKPVGPASRPVVALALVLGVLLIGAALPARAQVADAAIEVYALDDAGGPLPGVTVEIRSAEKGAVRTGVTSTVGAARFVALPPGSWSVKAKLAGFSAAEEKAVVLRVGQTQVVKITLRATRSEAVTVTASETAPLVDVYKLDTSTNIIPEQIQALPVANRNFEQLAFLAPTVQRERGEFRFVTGGPVIGSVGNASQSTFLVDGVDYTDPALGMSKTRISQDAISEFRVISNRFDSEVGQSAGGALSVVTRSGSNGVAGTAYGFYRDSGLTAQQPLQLETDLSTYRGVFGATFGGPIVKDQTFYFLSAEQVAQSTPTFFRPLGPTFSSLAADVPVPVHQTLLLGNLNHRFSDSVSGGLRFDYERYRQDNFRVGGTQDVSNGQELNRDNYNVTFNLTSTLSTTSTNEVRGQYGDRSYEEPPNSLATTDWYSLGTTLRTGESIYGDLIGKGYQWELRDTFYWSAGAHTLKAGASWMRIVDRSVIDTYPAGLFLWLTDTKAIPYAYLYGVGSSDVKANTNLIGAFVQDDWRPASNLTVSLGVRYDLDTGGNNPDFIQTKLQPTPRGRDTTNIQPRLGFTWDVAKDGVHVVNGGAGIFTGRYLLVPAFIELQQNGESGRINYTRLNGALFGFPSLTLDPNHPTTTGIALPPDVGLIGPKLNAPQATQGSLGYTYKIARTGLFASVEGLYAKGRDEIVIHDVNWSGNATHFRPNASYNQINEYTNDGRSEYKALVCSLNGTLKGGHIVTASATFASKHNTADDFSPEFPTGYPSDPANMDAEYGRARTSEKIRLVVSGVFRLPLGFSLAGTYEYGSGQPWTRLYGYDYNGDGKTGDRLPGVDRFGMDGPPFRELNLRVSNLIPISGIGVELIAEVFNIFNTANYDVASVVNGEFTSGPTITNPTAPYKANPAYGTYTSAFRGRQVQFGAKVSF
ncbi:MAG: TonB-dependent receptor domain-containing protein [Thermoanaerobaculia bacterium]